MNAEKMSNKNKEDVIKYINRLLNCGLGKQKCLEYLIKFINDGVYPEDIRDNTPENEEPKPSKSVARLINAYKVAVKDAQNSQKKPTNGSKNTKS